MVSERADLVKGHDEKGEELLNIFQTKKIKQFSAYNSFLHVLEES